MHVKSYIDFLFLYVNYQCLLMDLRIFNDIIEKKW